MQELLGRQKGLFRQILIVDDEPIEREMLGNMLDKEYEVCYAENGEQALDVIRDHKLTLSLVILDLHMPKLDGYSLLEILRADAELRLIPAIVLTSEKEAEVKSLQLGAADFITKPYDVPEVINARVRRSIELAEDSIIIHETERDSLTGLFNKEFFYEYGRRLENHNEDMSMDAIVLDINRFHLVNELYGRSYGDFILKTIGESIHGLVQRTGGLACRSDTNSFCIYLPHREDYEEQLPLHAEKFARRIGDYKISIRVGIFPDDGSGLDLEQRFDRARLACSKLRNSYTTCYTFYNTKLHDKELYSERLINDMDRALEEKQFKVYYQPKYNIRGEKPVLSSAEALIRWVHPEFGMVSPGDFIPLFEDNGLIQKLDRYVWREAAAQIRDWKNRLGVTLPVSVNVSRVDIFDPMLESILEEIVNANVLKPEEFLLEVTESAYTDNSQQIIDTVNSLRRKGFKVEMDDFGSGYSSLNMLTSLPIDALKLDMKFIRNICSDSKERRMVEIMIEIADFLEVPVIAEGVEVKEQLDLLKEIGCDIIQGYYFSKPVPPEDLDKLIEQEDGK
ncbi:EAL domain-containing response regulator [Ruminococcus sp.]|uniref:putative bifunctional diguanylate cyclase/phosphodiesterase n=1 Tax=Ruminococcus sp. TaxID=41978 RepID=UPI0025DEAE73|nr:EAL domain-containing response regulator [Ruminococcus sp.]MBQ8967192.1 EAL domain-containing protein [Ruminococcus sp.]